MKNFAVRFVLVLALVLCLGAQTLPSARALVIVPGQKVNAQINGVTGQALDPKLLTTFDEADGIRKQTGADHVEEWFDASPNESILYADPKYRIYKLQPGDQSAGLLLNAQQTNPDGHWEGGPDKLVWVPTLVKPAPPDPQGQPNVDFMALAATGGLSEAAFRAEVLKLLNAILAK